MWGLLQLAVMFWGRVNRCYVWNVSVGRLGVGLLRLWDDNVETRIQRQGYQLAHVSDTTRKGENGPDWSMVGYFESIEYKKCLIENTQP